MSEVNQETELTTELYEPVDYKKVLDLIIPKRLKESHSHEQEALLNGRIICFIIGLTTRDGAPVAESFGFVDTYDIPPIDTWLMLKEGFLNERETVLLCWIPNEAIELMQRAIDVEILGSYYWLDEEKPEIISMLNNIMDDI
ncbi:MAG: hypothetical protein ACJAWV_004492 [Flammeovirgaceae bacterium]|jgi:hypothetical protein